MAFAAGTYLLGFVAGGLSVLSPCVLPLLPLVVGSAVSAHRYGVIALAAGLALSFAVTGVVIAAFGFSLGLDGGVLRLLADVMMGLFGVVLLSSRLQTRFATAFSGLEGFAGGILARVKGHGVGGQFLVGVLLGAVWSPCTGPTLGSAALLAAQQRQLPQVAITMLMFGLGAAVPLLVVGTLSREMMKSWRGRLLGAGYIGKSVMGGMLVVVSILVLSGFDRTIEAAFVARAPDWLTGVSGLA
jgi:cytochrome c biogenesis protein CcdA